MAAPAGDPGSVVQMMRNPQNHTLTAIQTALNALNPGQKKLVHNTVSQSIHFTPKAALTIENPPNEWAKYDYLKAFLSSASNCSFSTNDVVKECIQRGVTMASVDAKFPGLLQSDSRGQSALHVAAASGDQGACQQVLNILGFTFLAKADSDGYTPLHLAASGQVVEFLATRDPSCLSLRGGKRGDTPLHHAVRLGRSAEVIEEIIKQLGGQGLNATNAEHQTALHVAAERADLPGLAAFRILLQRGADETFRVNGKTALQLLPPEFQPMVETIQKVNTNNKGAQNPSMTVNNNTQPVSGTTTTTAGGSSVLAGTSTTTTAGGLSSDAGGPARYAMNTQPTGYVPIADFTSGFTPAKSCGKYLLEDAMQCFRASVPLLSTIIDECGEITQSKLQGHLAPPQLGGSELGKSQLFAIVCYTFDTSLLGIQKPEENLYYQLNKVLQTRDMSKLQHLRGYLYYLMGGLKALPSHDGVVYRGLDAAGFKKVEKHYVSGIKVHWSGLSSASENLRFATEAAGPDGVVLKLRVKDNAKKISQASAFPNEEEVLLLPNFSAMVSSDVYVDSSTGMRMCDLVEVQKEKTHTF